MIEKAYDRAKDILASNREKLEALAQSLLDNEVIFKEDVQRILGARPFASAASTSAEPAVEPEKQASDTSVKEDATADAETPDDAPEGPKADT